MISKLKSLIWILLISLIAVPGYCAVDFDGTDDYIDCGTEVTLTVPFTYAAWVNMDGTGDYGIIANKSDPDAYYGCYMMVEGGLITVSYGDGNGKGSANRRSLATDDTHVTADNWHHIAVNMTAADAGAIYFNGTSVAISSSGTGNAIDNGTGLECRIGFWEPYSFITNGEITEVYAFNDTLTVAEVALLATSRIKGIGTQFDNLTGYWPLDDIPAGDSCDGKTMRDLSGNGNNGTGDDGGNNTGLTSVGETVLSYPPGIIGQ